MSPAAPMALHGAEWSLVLEPCADGPPSWRYLGLCCDTEHLPPISELRCATTFSLDSERPLSFFPSAATGWFGEPALRVEDASGAEIAFVPKACEVDESSDTLTLTLTDEVSGLEATIVHRKMAGDALEISTALTNCGVQPVTVLSLASVMIPLPSDAREIVSWRGRHNAEFTECREAMPWHGWQRVTRQGLTGHGGPPACVVLCGEAGWHRGTVFAVQLAWSGNSRIVIERCENAACVLLAEAVLSAGEVVLQTGDTYEAPPVMLAISDNGRNGARAQQHAAVRTRLDWPSGAMPPRPVHLNSWEAVYFAQNEARMIALVEAAAELGVERFVLDDGWFAGRESDRVGLGDWTPDPVKYPNGLEPLAKRVEALGMQFGIWVEPEMVNPDSDLYRAHPDWVLALKGREQPTARHQLVLDMRRADVRDYLFDCLDRLLLEQPVHYLKWDHNRAHAPGGGSAQTRGTYALLERLRAAHPDVEIESCAAGGGRIDAGIARFSHRFWASDNLDAVSRRGIHRGFLEFMPPELMGAHVGASPSHATGRSQSLDFRAAVACQGHFGVELDPATLNALDREKLRDWIAFYQHWRGVTHGGQTILGEGPGGLAWQAQGDGVRFLLWLIRTDNPDERRDPPLPLPFTAGADWHVSLLRYASADGPATQHIPRAWSMGSDPLPLTGNWLARAGLPIPTLPAESAAIFLLERRP